MRSLLLTSFYLISFGFLPVIAAEMPKAQPAEMAPMGPRVVLPLEREAYFIGERVPLAVAGVPENDEIKLELTNADGRVLLYKGRPASLLMDTATLAAGEYRFELNGAPLELSRLFLTSPLRRSVASVQDESTPAPPQFDSKKKYTPEERATIERQHWDALAQTLRDSGVTSLFAMVHSDGGRVTWLDTLARAGTSLLINPDTRPTSFFPTSNMPQELDDMSQRMILTAQANGRYPNFAGFCFGWDTTGYATGNRRGLLQYWGWGDKTQALRNYIERVDHHVEEEFTRRTGFAPVRESEYIAYLLSIHRPEFATAIDLPTKLWLDEIAKHTKPMKDSERVDFEKRIDAWSAYLMGMYGEVYTTFMKNLRAVAPALRNTASVQVDHAAVRYGQYFPSAYTPLDFQYQSTWNDQVGGPDYSYQWLFTAGLLQMHRGERPTWLSNAFGAAHGRADIPGKFVRVAAHGLAWGASGIGFALEGFSNVIGGMNAHSRWGSIAGTNAEMDVRAGREFLDRFSALALEGRGDHGVGVLFSRSQFQRQHIAMGFGTATYKTFVALTRLGYTPRFVTEEELAAGKPEGIEALVVVGQTFELPKPVVASLEKFTALGGRILVDGNTSVSLPGAEKIAVTLPFNVPGKPHNWAVPNMAAGENDAMLYARWHEEVAPALATALGETGRGLFASEKGAAAQATLTQIDGGPDAKYVVAVNDSHIKSQADWHQVRETLRPTRKIAASDVVYDCTEEKRLGKAAPIDCDLTMTTVRVFAVLKRPLGKIDLSATQSVVAGGAVAASVRFLDDTGKPLVAALPFHISLRRANGEAHQEFQRATNRDGQFAMTVPIPANVPAGKWTLKVRSQLTGDTAVLPVTVTAGRSDKLAAPITERVIVRQKDAIDQLLKKGSAVVLPIFDSPAAESLTPVAEKIRTVLKARGVDVEIRRNPEISTYWFSYDPTDEQITENARAERSETIGKIQRQTANGNDWYSALSGYHFGKPLILLDLAGQHGENPLVEALDESKKTLGGKGLLWPRVIESFPGKGPALVQGIHWAFRARVPSLVIQAVDIDGLMAAAESLAKLPEDRLTPAIENIRAELWREHHVGDRPAQTQPVTLTATGLTTGHAPQPFAIRFVGETRPLPADQVKSPEPLVRAAVPVPGVFEPKQFVAFMHDGDRFIEAGAVSFLVPDLRFNEAIQLTMDVQKPGKTKITAGGLFRYSDRKPAWQAPWEDLIELREKLVPKERRAMEIEVLIDGKPAGKLVPVKTETTDVQIELRSQTANTKPKTVTEEVVTQIGGEIELPSGRHKVLLVHHNIVDGKLTAVAVGAELPSVVTGAGAK